MNDPSSVRISIVIPVFNAEPFLATCLDSIFSNTGSFEIIAINDASSDHSLSILDDYAKQHSNLTVVRFSQNRGVSAARNAGIAHSRGQYIMFCDPDDSFVPGSSTSSPSWRRRPSCRMSFSSNTNRSTLKRNRSTPVSTRPSIVLTWKTNRRRSLAFPVCSLCSGPGTAHSNDLSSVLCDLTNPFGRSKTSCGESSVHADVGPFW